MNDQDYYKNYLIEKEDILLTWLFKVWGDFFYSENNLLFYIREKEDITHVD